MEPRIEDAVIKDGSNPDETIVLRRVCTGRTRFDAEAREIRNLTILSPIRRPAACSLMRPAVSSRPMSVSVLKSARIISALTLVSRIFGLGRDMLFAYVFGAGWVMSAFTVGFQIPNLFRRLFGEGALSASSIPVLTEQLHRGGCGAVDRLSGKVMALLLVVLVALTMVGELVVLALWTLVEPTDRNLLTLSLTAVMLPYMIFICASAILGGIQNIFGQFAIPAANPILLNVFEIIAMLVTVQLFAKDLVPQAYILAVVVLFTGVVQFGWQWTALRRTGLRLRLAIDTSDACVRTIARTMIPMTIGLSAIQINAFLDSLIAYALVTSHVGGPAVLGYAQRLYQFPLGVFAIALATAIFPAMTRHAAENDLAGLSRTLARGLRVVVFEGLPCTVGLILIREPLVQLLFERGQFTPVDTVRVANTLIAFAAGIWAFGANQIAVRAFYATKDPMTPLRIAGGMVAANLALNLILVFPLEEPGIGLATTICAVIQDGLLIWFLSKRLPHIPWKEIINSAGRSILATVVMALAVLTANHLLNGWPAYAHSPLLKVACLASIGLLAFLAGAKLARCPELHEVLHRH